MAAALRQLSGEATSNLIVGNALGSCFGQFGLVMGITGLIGRLSLAKEQVAVHGGMLLLSMLLLAVVGWDGLVNRVEGAILAGCFVAYICWLVGREREAGGQRSRSADRDRVGRIWLHLTLGMALVVGSADVVVYQAITLARVWGVDQSFIGITIVGVGTSLPELMISLGAALRSRMALSVGNLLGSNILDILLPIGTAALITPLDFDAGLLQLDLPILFVLSLLILVLLALPTGIRRPQALLLLGSYFGYLLLISPML